MTTLKEFKDAVVAVGGNLLGWTNGSKRDEDELQTGINMGPVTTAAIVNGINASIAREAHWLRQRDAAWEQNAFLIDENLALKAKIEALEKDHSVNGYQDKAMRTYKPTEGLSGKDAMLLGALGLAGEAGEVAELIKKHVFHGKPLDMAHLVKELGDVLWYLAVMARTVPNVTLGTVARTNITKLLERYPDGFCPAKANNRKPGDK